MRELIYFELKKALSLRKAGVYLCMMMVCCGIIFWFSKTEANFEYVREMQGKYKGPVTEGAVAESVSRHKELYEKEQAIGLTEAERMEYDELETPLWMNQCDLARKENLEKYGIYPKTIRIGNTIFYGYLENFIARYLPLLFCFLISFLIGPVCSMEYENRMDELLLSAKNGKRKVIYAKMIAALVLSAGCWTFLLLDYAVMTVVGYGWGDWKASFVFAAGDPFVYLNSPFDFTVGQYLLVLSAVSFLGCMGYALFALFVSSKCRYSVLSSMLGLAVGAVPFLLSQMYQYDQSPSGVRIRMILRFAYSQIIGVRALFGGQSMLEFGNFRMCAPWCVLPFLCAATAALAVWTCRSFGRWR